MEIPDAVPVMTLPSATLFPQALLPLYIFEPRYRQMLTDMLRTERMFTVAMQKPGRVRETPCETPAQRLSTQHDPLSRQCSPEFRSVLFKAVGLTLLLFIAVLVAVEMIACSGELDVTPSPAGRAPTH